MQNEEEVESTMGQFQVKIQHQPESIKNLGRGTPDQFVTSLNVTFYLFTNFFKKMYLAFSLGECSSGWTMLSDTHMTFLFNVPLGIMHFSL